MTETTVGTIETMLESALDRAEDPEVRFKLRSALQLLLVVENRHVETREALAEADVDEELRADLRDLGYLD